MMRWTWFGLGWLVLAGVPLQGADPAAAAAPVVEFTAEERAWMAAHPVIRVGNDTSYEPYAIQDEDGKIVGIDQDYLQLIAQRTGLRFVNETRRNWAQMLEAFKSHEVDLLPSLGHTDERESFTIFSEPYAYAPNVIVTRVDSPFLFSLRDLQGRTVSIPRGYAGLRVELNESAPGSIVAEYDSPLECYKAVASGAVFASFGDLANASYLIRLNQLTNLRLGSVLFTQSDNYFGVRRDWPELATILNKTLASITKEDRQRISNRWIAVDYSADRWWVAAFKVAAGIAAAATAFFSLMIFHNRRLASELAERRRIQAELELVRDKLERTSQEKSELMHMVAHDLRSPLTGIHLSVDLLQLDPPMSDTDLKSTLGRIKESVGKMARLINDLLSAQNVEEGRFTLNVSAGDAGQLVRAAVAAVRSTAQHKRITLEAILPDQPVPLTTDFVALQQVVDNLLSNALKYSPPGSRIEITLKANAARCRFEVCDQGPGVKPEEREKIFEKFGRGSAVPTQGEPSTGLGLWIVRRFVKELGGKVWCEPVPSAIGSVFIVEVPLTMPAT